MTGSHSPIADICNIDAEQGLLGAILMNNAAFARVSSIVRPGHFFEPIHARLFEMCGEMILDGRTASPVTLKTRFPADLDIAGLTPPQYMARLMAEAAAGITVPDYAKAVREAWAARQVVAAARSAAAGVAQPGADVKGVISVLLGDIDGTRAELDDGRVVRQPISACLSEVLLRVDAIRGGRMEPGATTGLADLDRMMGGLQPGRLIIVAGRPGMGKSIIGANLARATAAAGNGCLFFSLEMPSEEIGARMLADQALRDDGAAITSSAIFEGRLDGRQLREVETAAEALAGLPLLIDTSAALSVGEILARTRSAADEMQARGIRLKVVVIDYLKFVRASDRYRGQRVYEVGEITAGLKALAKDLGVCVVLLAQLNRAVEQRADKRPELSDLRESGDIEADADVVLLLFREAYYLKDKTDPEAMARLLACENALEIIIAKCRMGAVGVVEVFCHPGASAVRDRR